MATYRLTGYAPVDLSFGRGETPSFRLTFTGVDPADVASWVIDAPIRRAARMTPFAAWDVTVQDTSVLFSLPADVTETLPDGCRYSITITLTDDVVRNPISGDLLVDDRDRVAA